MLCHCHTITDWSLKATLVNMASWSELPTGPNEEHCTSCEKSVNTVSREEPDLQFVRDGRVQHYNFQGSLVAEGDSPSLCRAVLPELG